MVYTLSYTAASPSQQLIVAYRTLTLYDLVYGNVTLQSASLQSSAPPGLYISNPAMIGSGFMFSFPTQSGTNYTVQCAYSLPATNWLSVTNLIGTGGIVSVTNQAGAAWPKFYRIKRQ